MTPDRPEKKSETIRVRVPFSLKRQFLARAEREGRSASEIFRDFMEDYVRRPAERPDRPALPRALGAVRRHPRPAFAAILGAAGISALLAGAIPAGAASDSRLSFDRLDANGDGVLSEREYTQPDFRRVRTEVFDAEGNPITPKIVPRTTLGLAVITPGPGSDDPVRLIALPPQDPESQDPGANQIERLVREFARTDANGDKTVSFEEYDTRAEASRNRGFDLLDLNGDGGVSAAELTSLGASQDLASVAMQSIDVSGDGRIDRGEYHDTF